MGFFLPKNASRLALKEAQQAHDERRGIIKALSHGKVSRRDLIKLGLITRAGMLGLIRGLNPFQPSLLAQTPGGPGIPTGLPPSALFVATSFIKQMPPSDFLPRKAMSSLD